MMQEVEQPREGVYPSHGGRGPDRHLWEHKERIFLWPWGSNRWGADQWLHALSIRVTTWILGLYTHLNGKRQKGSEQGSDRWLQVLGTRTRV